MEARYRLASIAAAILVLGIQGRTQVTELVSVDSAEVQAGDYSYLPSVSDDGRYVVFTSSDSLAPEDTNFFEDVYVRDRIAGTTLLVSIGMGGAAANAGSYAPQKAITPDGRYVAFGSRANNLTVGDTGTDYDVFVRDLQLGTTQRVSLLVDGTEGNGESGGPAISADGRFVAFQSSSSDLVIGDTNVSEDIFVKDRQTGTVERVSLTSVGGQLNSGTYYLPKISADGRYVAFLSSSTNAVPGDTNGKTDLFLRDRQTGTTERVSLDTSGSQFTGDTAPWFDLAADGSRVCFSAPYPDPFVQVYVRDTTVDATEQITAGIGPVFEGSGPSLAFVTGASLVPGDSNNHWDVYVWEGVPDVFERVSLSNSGAQANDDCVFYGIGSSADGRFVVFDAYATNLVGIDMNGITPDIFLRDREAAGFTSHCHPGIAGIQTCPCGNPPSSTGRGCNNSAATGGAILSASGIAYLSMDSLVFTTSGEKPTALSTVWQGPATPAAGIIFGQGVRCASGSLKRLYNKSAVGGSITAPNFGAGDPSVSARAATLGAPISAGQSRYYFVSYRDPIVLGGCPSTSTFNATQTGRVVWSH